MLAVDTNVLVRLLVDDPAAPGQCQAARKAASEAGELFVPQVVQIETAWVLAGAYGLGRAPLFDILQRVAQHPALHLQRPSVFLAALERFAQAHADFADCMILAESADADCELATFDRKLGRQPGARLIR